MGVDIAQREQNEPLDPTSLQEGVHIDLTPHDVWVLGQLIEADTASLPRDAEESILDGYRILKATGYEPPTEADPPNVDLKAPHDEAQLAAATPHATTPEAPASVLREVLITEVKTADPSPITHETPPDPSTGLQAQEPIAPALERVAAAVEELKEEVTPHHEPATDSTPEPKEQPASGLSSRLVFDAILITASVLVASLFVTAGALLQDPIFAALALGLMATAAWLILPWMREDATGGPA